MSDSEFSLYFASLTGAQQQWIDKRIIDGATFLRSRGKTVHTLECRAGGYRPSNRLEAWSARVPGMDMQVIRRQLREGKQPPMPEMLGRVDLAVPGVSYRRCRVCAPDVPDIEDNASSRGSRQSVATFLRYVAQKYQDRPSIALLKILELHECTLGGTCIECAAVYPCRTIESVWLAYNLGGDS